MKHNFKAFACKRPIFFPDWCVVVTVTRPYGKAGLDSAVTSVDCTARSEK
jgi:hypothetical protein